MTQTNCIVCAKEFASDELHSDASLKVNSTRFKVCQACLDSCDPAEDYRQALDVVNSYLKFAEARSLLEEAQEILDSRK